MGRVALCLFFIAILHTGIIKFSQANETSTDVISKKDEELTTDPPKAEPAKESEVPSKVEADEKSGVSSKEEPKVEKVSDVPEKKDDKPEEKEAKENESQKEDVTQKTASSDNRNFIPTMLKGVPVEQAKVMFEFPKSILGSVNLVGGKIGEAVSKGLDTAKDTFKFLRTSTTNLFGN